MVQYGAFDWLDAPIERVGARFGPLPFAPGLEQWVVPQADDVLEAIRRTVARLSPNLPKWEGLRERAPSKSLW